MDATTEDLVFGRLLGPQGLLRKERSAVIIATHAGKELIITYRILKLIQTVNLLPSADHIIVLGQQGNIQEQGSFRELNTNNGYVQNLLVKQFKGKTEVAAPPLKHTLGKKQVAIEPTADKKRQLGDMTVYWFYFQKIGTINTLLIFLFAFMFVGFTTFPSKPMFSVFLSSS